MANNLENIKQGDLVNQGMNTGGVALPFNTPVSFPSPKKHAFYLRIPFIICVILPIFFGTIYYGLIATDRYVSHAQLTVRSAEGGAADLLGGLIGAMGGGSNSGSESYVVEQYIKSRDIVDLLQDVIDLRSIYSTEDADILSRLDKDATNEELHEYYLDRVHVVYDSTKQLIELKVEAFSAEEAQLIGETIIDLCDHLVNQISRRTREDAISHARTEVARAEKRVENARLSLSDFRLQHGDLDPVSSAVGMSGIVIGLEAELARAQTELTSLRSYLQETSSQVSAAVSRVVALQKQLNAERQRLVGEESNKNFIPLLAEYERLKIEDELSKEAYRISWEAMEFARAEANRKHLYLVSFVSPSLADEATEPQRLVMIAAFIICSLLIYGLLSLLTAAIKEHARV